MEFLNKDNIFFVVLDYPISYLEFMATLTSLIFVGLSAMASVWNWPLAIVSSILSLLLFYQVQLYPDMFLQIFFCITAIIGWWRWTHPKPMEEDKNHELRISWMKTSQLLLLVTLATAGTLLMGLSAQHFHEWFPYLFTEPSASPFLDSFITTMSIITTYYVIQKKIESWIMWIVIDLVATYLYYVRDIKLYSFLYFGFCIVALFGLWNWITIYRGYIKKY